MLGFQWVSVGFPQLPPSLLSSTYKPFPVYILQLAPEFRLSLCTTALSLALEFVGVSPGCLQPTQLSSRMRAGVCFISHLKTVRISTCHCWRRTIACFPFPAQTSRPRGGKTVARTRGSSAYPQSRHMLCDPVLQWLAGGKGGKRVVNHATTTHFILPDLCLAFFDQRDTLALTPPSFNATLRQGQTHRTAGPECPTGRVKRTRMGQASYVQDILDISSITHREHPRAHWLIRCKLVES